MSQQIVEQAGVSGSGSGQVRGVIFDVDGTLVDSNTAHAQAWADALWEHGFSVSFERVLELIGMGGDNLLPEAIQVEKDSAIGERLAERRGEIFKSRYLPRLKAFGQTRALVERIKQDGIRVAVASSAQQDELETLLNIAQVDDLFEAVTSSDDAENSKPDPDIIQAALARLSLPPEQAIMIGDTEYDLEASAKAGVRVIAFRSGGRTDEQLQGAVAIYDDPADLLAHYDQSPLAAR